MNHEKDSWSRTDVQGCNSKKNGSSAISFAILVATVGMFDWRLFDNSNGTKIVQQPKKLGCSTQIMFDGKLTIVEHKINRTKSER